VINARQRPLSKQKWNRPLLGNNSINNDGCYAIAASVMLATTEEQRNGVFWWPVLRGYTWEDLLDSSL
jgi:hypothetical protein